MSRLINVASSTSTAAAPAVAGQTADDRDGYLARVAKFIPAEVVGLYLFAQGVIISAPATQIQRVIAVAVVVLVLLVATPFYFKETAKKEKERRNLSALPKWKTQAVVAVLALLVWVYALGVAGVLGAGYVPWIASLILALFSFGVGRLVPNQ